MRVERVLLLCVVAGCTTMVLDGAISARDVAGAAGPAGPAPTNTRTPTSARTPSTSSTRQPSPLASLCSVAYQAPAGHLQVEGDDAQSVLRRSGIQLRGATVVEVPAKRIGQTALYVLPVYCCQLQDGGTRCLHVLNKEVLDMLDAGRW